MTTEQKKALKALIDAAIKVGRVIEIYGALDKRTRDQQVVYEYVLLRRAVKGLSQSIQQEESLDETDEILNKLKDEITLLHQ